MEKSLAELVLKLDAMSIQDESDSIPQGISQELCAQWRTLKTIRNTLTTSTQNSDQFAQG